MPVGPVHPVKPETARKAGEAAHTRPAISVCFRFHTNFYHSYRGNSLDDRGIGRDIRIIRGIIRDLDALNHAGVPVRGTWDIENYYSLQQLIPLHAPDILAGIQRRVGEDRDEVELMSWNNGMLSAHTPPELSRALGWAWSNPDGSGLADLFQSVAPVLRPQENMICAAQIPQLKAAGVRALSLYYSSLPFNGFGSFIPPLSLTERFGALEFTGDGSEGSIPVLPAVNHGDIADNGLSLRRWLKRLRRAQLRDPDPRDLLFILDLDADDRFWDGMVGGVASRLVPAFGGLRPLVESIADLDFIRFDRPWSWLQDHPPMKAVRVDRDLADGSFDGYSSWAEKWENAAVWTVLQRSRLAAELREQALDPRTLDNALTARVRTLSTTHFGLAAPVMNSTRLQDALAHAGKALDLAGGNPASGDIWALGTLLRGDPKARSLSVQPRTPGRADSLLVRSESGPVLEETIAVPWYRFGRRIIRAVPGPAGGATDQAPSPTAVHNDGPEPLVVEGRIPAPAGVAGSRDGWFRQVWHQTAALPYLLVELELQWPQTPAHGFNKEFAARLEREWDARWMETAPLELVPHTGATSRDPARVWRHGYHGHVTSYPLDQHQFSRNRRIASLNNHVTDAWMAVSGPAGGILIAQSPLGMLSPAFCPLRVEFSRGTQGVRCNPFGTWYGPQLRYPTARTGLGRLSALATAHQLSSLAPSWNGRNLHLVLLIAAFGGTEPPPTLQQDALAFARAVRALPGSAGGATISGQ